MRRQRSTRAGFSLIEVVISTLLVGLVIAGAMRCVAGVTRGRMSTTDSVHAEQLAQQLMSEIVQDQYIDEGTPLFGPEESNANRSEFDDVDDYHLWTARPPVDRDGNPFVDMAGWQRDVTVEWVDPADPATTSGTDQGVKRITVTIKVDDVKVATLVSLRGAQYP